jgi:hypothetical protein
MKSKGNNNHMIRNNVKSRYYFVSNKEANEKQIQVSPMRMKKNSRTKAREINDR